ncbi:MAG: isoprenylcysteine carboxylmethyltransferase family protein [Blastocatellia bacterium]|nr:isoprenylcysteine carboxylmethyltransferase family protein [Blastocatellia bacterium]
MLGLSSLVLATPQLWSLFLGLIPATVGILFRTWASGHLRKNECLATSGPYAYTRNPLYFGSFLLGTGFSLATGRPVLVVIFILFFLTVYWSVMRTEAEHMKHLFGDKYTRYAEDVPLFWPSLKPWPASVKAEFDPALYFRYREYRALIGMLAAIAFLAVRVYWPIWRF